VGGLEPVGLQAPASSCWINIGSSSGFGVVSASSLTTRTTSAHSAMTKINTPMMIRDVLPFCGEDKVVDSRTVETCETETTDHIEHQFSWPL
jgi:hypothetical protein